MDYVKSWVMLGAVGLISSYSAYAEDNTTKQITQLNSQIQSQMQKQTESRAKEMKDFNTKNQLQ